MKKILIGFLFVFLFSCSEGEKLNDNQSQIYENDQNSHFNDVTFSGDFSTEEQFYSLKPNKVFYNKTIVKEYKDFFNLYKKNISYFKNERKEELFFYYVWSDYLYGTNLTNGTCNNLDSCISGKISSDKVGDKFCKLICEGKDEFNMEERENFALLKNSFIKYKKILNGENIKIETVDDYFVGNIFKGKYSEEDLLNEYFYFTSAVSLGKCNFLKDKYLVGLCNNYVKIYN